MFGAAVLFALGGAAPAEAAQVRGVFDAYVTTVGDPAVWNGAQVGDAITGAFTYDTAYLPPNDPFCAAHGRGCYFAANPAHSFLSITMTLDGVTYDFADDQSTTLTIGDLIQTLPGYRFDQFTVGAVGAVTEIGGAAPGAHTGSAFAQVYPYRQIFTSADPLQTFKVVAADMRGTTADTATLDGEQLGFSTLSMSDVIIGAGGAPEPSTWAMLLVGFAGLGAALRSVRRRAGAAA